MPRVLLEASMSLDGFVEDDRGGGFDRLFAWYGNGDVEIRTADPGLTFRVSAASADRVREMDRVGALVVGRKAFDYTGGWNGRHPVDVPVFVLTHRVPEDWVSAHPDAPFTFVTSGGAAEVVRRAVEAAGDRDVAVGPGEVAGAVLDAGLLDEVRINLVPLWLGAGKPLFGRPATVPATFGTPTVVEGDGVTHLTYRVPSGRA